MATLSRGQTFGVTETVTNTKLHDLVDSASITGILNADIDNSAAIANSKLVNLTDAGKVSGSSFFNLTSIPSGAGLIPAEQLLTAFPVGSVYINITGDNPGTFIGGTWVAFGEGRVLVGVDASDADFDASEKTGGAKTHTLITAEMPAHTHNYDKPTSNSTSGSVEANPGRTLTSTATSSAGSGSAHNNLQPYITVYMWKRTV